MVVLILRHNYRGCPVLAFFARAGTEIPGAAKLSSPIRRWHGDEVRCKGDVGCGTQDPSYRQQRTRPFGPLRAGSCQERKDGAPQSPIKEMQLRKGRYPAPFDLST